MIATALSSPVPLRNTTVWGRYASIVSIPRIYGQATITAIPYDASGKLFVVADHVAQGVPAVKAGGTKTTAYSFFHQPDTTGKVIAFIRLQNAIDLTTQTVTATVSGILHPVTGKIMINPADVAWDILQWVTGQAISRDRFARWATECDTAGLSVAGSITDATQTTRALLDSIAESALSTWSAGLDGFGIMRQLEVLPSTLSAENGGKITAETGDTLYV